MKGVRGTLCKQTGIMGQSGAPKPDLVRPNSRVGAPNWRANFAVGARQVPSWRANFDLASKKLASTQKTHVLQHINKATQPYAVKYR